MAIFTASKGFFAKKIIAGLIMVLMFMPAAWPSRTHAFLGLGDIVTDLVADINTGLTNVSTTSTGVASWKQVFSEIAKTVLKVVAQKALQRITEDTVNWINQGFEGKPLFVQNPDSFFTKIEDDEMKNAVNEIGNDLDKYPWGQGTARNKVRQARSSRGSTTADRIGTFDLNTRFNLNSPAEIEQFYNDTRIGGWDGWTAMVDNPNNNPIGFDLALSNDLKKQTEQKTENWEKSISGMFLPTQECADPKGLTRAEEDALRNAKNPEAYETGKCKRWEDTTPSTMVAGKIASALTSGERQSELGAAVGSSLSKVFSALLNQFIDKGLSTLSTNIGVNNIIPQSDTWEFMGETLTLGSGDGSPANQSWNQTFAMVTLSGFSDQVETDIGLVEKHIEPIGDIIKIIEGFKEKSMSLDQCLPGPDLRWKARFATELDRNTKKLDKKANKNDEDKANDAITALANLDTAAQAFAIHIDNVVLTELAVSLPAIDWLKTLGNKLRKQDNYKGEKTEENEKLARLIGIKNALSELSEPLDDTEKETFKDLWLQHKVMKVKLPTEDTVIETGVEKKGVEDWETALQKLNEQCVTQRIGKIERYIGDNEQWRFCNGPMDDGFWQDEQSGDYIYPQNIPVNAKNIFHENDIEVSCDIIYKSTLSDYSKPDY